MGLALAGCLGGAGLPPPLSDERLDAASEAAARDLYGHGVAEIGERRYETAYAAFDSVVGRFPASRYSGLSLRERGLAAYRLGRHRQAAEDLRRFLQRAPGYETTDTAIVLASALEREDDPAGALRTLGREVPARDDAVEGARQVAEVAVRDLPAGDSAPLAAELPERRFLVPLYVRAAAEIRARDPKRAADLTRLADRLGGGRARAGGRVALEEPRAAGSGTAVGAILPQGGRLAGVAQDIQDGARLALEELAASGPPYTLEVMPEEGSGASLEALADRGIRVVIGPLASEPALSAAPAARQRGVLMVSPTATDSNLLHAGPGIFAPNATRGELGEALGGFAARDLGLLRVATLASDDDHGRANALAFRRTFEGRGGSVVLEQFYGKGSTNFGLALRTARREGAQALFLPTRSADHVLTVISQMAYYSGTSFRLLGTEIWRDDRFLSRAGSFAEGAHFADTFSPDRRVTRYWDFRSAYYRRYGRALSGNFPGWGYDAVMLALRYLSEAQTPPDATYVGAAATYRIGEDGVDRVPVISRISEGQPVLVSFEDRAR